MYIDHHIKQVGKVLTCTDSSGKIVVNKYDNKTSRIIFDLDGTIPGKLYFALLNPTTKKYFLTPINNNEIEITSAISVYPGLWSAIIIGADANYEIIDNNIDQTKLTYISDEFKKIVVRDNFLNELNIEESQSPANLFDFLSEAQGYVVLSKRYAVGDDKVEGSDVDNAKYYMNETKKLFNDFEGTVKDTVVEVVGNQMDILGNEIDRVDSELNQALSETNQSVEELNDELYHFKINTEERIKTLEELDIDVDITVDSELNPESENPIQNKVVTKVLDNVTKDVADVKNSLTELSNVKEIINTASGETIVLTDSAESKLEGLRVHGKSEQFTTTGAQLIPFPYDNMRLERNGLVFEVSDDGGIKINGTATDITYYGVRAGNTAVSLQAGTYKVQGFGFIEGVKLITYLNTSNKYVDMGKTFTLSEAETVNITFQIESGANINITVYPFLHVGTETLPYEPYTGGIPSPNPQYPQEITSVGDDGEVEVGVYGGNLFNTSNLVDKNVTTEIFDNGRKITVTGSNSYARSELAIQAQPLVGKVIYLKGAYTGNSKPAITTVIRRKDGTVKYANTTVMGEGYLIDESINSFDVQLICNNSSTTLNEPKTAVFEDVILTFDKNMTWTPYVEKQPLTIPTPNGLPAIKVGKQSDANYTDEEGNMWCCDEIDFERGVYVQRIIKRVLDGSEVIGWYADKPWHMSAKSLFGSEIKLLGPQEQGIGTYAMSDRFIVQNTDYQSSYSDYISKMYYSVSGGEFTVNANELFETRDGEGFKKFFSEHPTTIYCILKEPIETPLTAEEIEAYRALHTNYPTTTIISDAHMEVKYGADTKNYIDNKFAEMQTAIVSRISSLEANML